MYYNFNTQLLQKISHILYVEIFKIISHFIPIHLLLNNILTLAE
jgi:hypothetical protein